MASGSFHVFHRHILAIWVDPALVIVEDLVKTVCVYSANIATCRIALEVLDRVAVCLDCILLRWVHGSECFDDMPVVIDRTYYGEVCGSIA